MSYHNNFEFIVGPKAGQRSGRYVTPSTGNRLLIGAPVTVNVGVPADSLGLQAVALATGAQAPATGKSGVLSYEFKNAEGYAGDDPYLTVWSDKALVPLGDACMVIHGDHVRLRFRNTTDSLFLNTRLYPGRTMVAGIGATPTINAGDLLTPGTGDDTSGYWAKTTNAADGWLVVTFVDNVRNELEAEFLF